ncbi:2525_t:CDS:10 [Cetraspora pellucida]|uniref:2525_t:CDS:1 n=1 Tax=Cetraspora pellucida TaxID=1433469 RepID=A0A9N9A9E1_9GLOM|nr:2525_t:CDS:10 [Cetraspora pellucida]
MEFFERSEEWSLLNFLKYLDSVESLSDCSEVHHKYKLLLTSIKGIKDDKENEFHSFEIKEFWQERNLRIVLKEKTVKRDYDQANNKEDDCSNKRRHGMKKNETEQPHTPEENIIYFHHIFNEEPSTMVLREQKRVCYAENSTEIDLLKSYYEEFKIDIETKQYICKVCDSREGTPCTTTHEVTNPIIVTSNKSVITNSDYSTIVFKIIAETEVEDNEITEDTRFLCFIRNTLLDFTATFKFLTPKVINRDLLILQLSDAVKILDIEVSGPPFNYTKKHTIGNAKKLLLLSVCSLCKILANNFDCSIEDVKQQEKIQKRIHSFIPSADNNNEDLRE